LISICISGESIRYSKVGSGSLETRISAIKSFIDKNNLERIFLKKKKKKNKIDLRYISFRTTTEKHQEDKIIALKTLQDTRDLFQVAIEANRKYPIN